MLEVRGLETSYGASQVLFGVDLDVVAGEIVALLGRNGMGKTTTIRSVMGLTPAHGGTISFCDSELRARKPYMIARAGIGLVPEGRQIFPNLSVEENLVATMRNTSAGRTQEPVSSREWTLTDIHQRFPVLKERASAMGNQLSGGEQQMLAIARALLTNPKLLILDEATEGLAPMIRKEIWATISTLKDEGLGILVVDRDLGAVGSHARTCVVLEKGVVVWKGSGGDLAKERETVESFLTV